MSEKRIETSKISAINSALNTAFFDVLRQYNKAFFVTDNHTYKQSYDSVKKCLEIIESTELSLLVHTDLSYPYTDNAMINATSLMRDFNCDVIIVYGDDDFLERIKILSAVQPTDSEALQLGATQVFQTHSIPIIYMPKTIVFKAGYQTFIEYRPSTQITRSIHTFKPSVVPTVFIDYDLISSQEEVRLRDAAMFLFAQLFDHLAQSDNSDHQTKDYFSVLFDIIENGEEAIKPRENQQVIENLNRYLAQYPPNQYPLLALETLFRYRSVYLPQGLITHRLICPYFKMLLNKGMHLSLLASMNHVFSEDVIGLPLNVQARKFVEHLNAVLGRVYQNRESLHKYDIDNTQISDYMHDVNNHLPELQGYSEDDLYHLFETMLIDS